ncbi:hypothetical protein J6590_030051 [Homalodisca vitripennis]|nr:hypothetical protein J6590_030051 [Homalodisca vitripennis]
MSWPVIKVANIWKPWKRARCADKSVASPGTLGPATLPGLQGRPGHGTTGALPTDCINISSVI